MRLILLAALLLALSSLATGQIVEKQAGQVAKQQTFDSPRLVSLRNQLERGEGAASERFWQEVQQKGTPLIEAIKGSKEDMLVTFLWRAVQNTKNVLVAIPLTLQGKTSEHYMMHLLETDLWYKTYRLRKEARFQYLLIPNDPLAAMSDTKDPIELKKRVANVQSDPLNPKRFQGYPREFSVVWIIRPSVERT